MLIVTVWNKYQSQRAVKREISIHSGRIVWTYLTGKMGCATSVETKPIKYTANNITDPIASKNAQQTQVLSTNLLQTPLIAGSFYYRLKLK